MEIIEKKNVYVISNEWVLTSFMPLFSWLRVNQEQLYRCQYDRFTVVHLQMIN